MANANVKQKKILKQRVRHSINFKLILKS